MNEFENLVAQMRNAQIKYFQNKEVYWLYKSKQWEKQVDEHLESKNNLKLDL